jgi:hypothetical protein
MLVRDFGLIGTPPKPKLILPCSMDALSLDIGSHGVESNAGM